jgi:hypothetical protein
MASYEQQGAGYDSGARGYELQGRKRYRRREERQWEPEELEQVAACSAGTGRLLRLAGELDRTYEAVRTKRSELRHAADTRKACGAFLPDTGLPYRVRMLRLHEQHRHA